MTKETLQMLYLCIWFCVRLLGTLFFKSLHHLLFKNIAHNGSFHQGFPAPELFFCKEFIFRNETRSQTPSLKKQKRPIDLAINGRMDWIGWDGCGVILWAPLCGANKYVYVFDAFVKMPQNEYWQCQCIWNSQNKWKGKFTGTTFNRIRKIKFFTN